MPVGQNSRAQTVFVPAAKADTIGSGTTASEAVKTPPQPAHLPRRRSQRVYLEMPLLVYGRGPDDDPFSAEAHTVVVNAHGALITLAEKLNLGEKLILTNPKTWEEVECRIVFLRSTKGHRKQVGVEFLSPSPNFWRMAFRPDDSNAAQPKRPERFNR